LPIVNVLNVLIVVSIPIISFIGGFFCAEEEKKNEVKEKTPHENIQKRH